MVEHWLYACSEYLSSDVAYLCKDYHRLWFDAVSLAIKVPAWISSCVCKQPIKSLILYYFAILVRLNHRNHLVVCHHASPFLASIIASAKKYDFSAIIACPEKVSTSERLPIMPCKAAAAK